MLKLNVRASKPDEKIMIALCEKWLLTSIKCVWIPVSTGSEARIWRKVEAPFTTNSLGDNLWYASKPVKLSLRNLSQKSHIDIDEVRMDTIGGKNLLLNGDFSKAMDHWFFSADEHLQWHAKSLPVAVVFDQGWFGLLALGLFSILAIKRAASSAWRGSLQAATALAALVGFLVVGLFDTLIDTPRFLFLLILLGGFCACRDRTVMPRDFSAKNGTNTGAASVVFS